jgi:uncharacterized protein YjiS (DUF1127 family)
MRDYALTQAIAHESLGASLVNLIRNWRERHETQKLLDRDDRTLSQLGFTRDDVKRVLALPISQNCRLALEEIAFIRSLH